jgi:hypothetical protein
LIKADGNRKPVISSESALQVVPWGMQVIVGGSDDTAEAKKRNHESLWDHTVDSSRIGKSKEEVLG